jgi:hypothetical protein
MSIFKFLYTFLTLLIELWKDSYIVQMSFVIEMIIKDVSY